MVQKGALYSRCEDNLWIHAYAYYTAFRHCSAHQASEMLPKTNSGSWIRVLEYCIDEQRSGESHVLLICVHD